MSLRTTTSRKSRSRSKFSSYRMETEKNRCSSSSSCSGSSQSSSSSKSSSSSSSSSSPLHYKYKIGERIKDGKYSVLAYLNEGTFGRVLLVINRQTQRKYAMKVIRKNRQYEENAEEECEALRYVNEKEPEKFLGPSLHDLILRNKRDRKISIELIKSIGYQVIKAIGTLHSMGILHTDLKPENILFAQPQKLTKFNRDCYEPEDDRIKIIDFGGAVFDDESHTGIINTRQYRSPEVQLQCCKWGPPSDVWGIGCILVELYLGQILFPTRKDEYEHMALIEKRIRPFPQWMAKNCQGSLRKHFYRDPHRRTGSYYDWPEHATEEAEKRVSAAASLNQLISNVLLLDLANKLLDVDPIKRITCKEALKHPFFN